MRPGFAKMLRDNRNHQAGQNNDDNFVMTDMFDGDAWNEQRTGAIQQVGANGTFQDIALQGRPALKNLNDRRYGLHLSLNGDW